MLDRIQKMKDKEEVFLSLNDLEVKCLKNSFKAVFKEIEEWEFQTRVGIYIEEAKEIEKKLD